MKGVFQSFFVVLYAYIRRYAFPYLKGLVVEMVNFQKIQQLVSGYPLELLS